MADDFAGRTVVIAGGSKGIGLAIARRFAALGARVVIGARGRQPECDALPDAEFVPCDMNDPDGPCALVRSAAARGGPISVLVNCVGGGIIRPDPVNVTDDQWMDMLSRSFLYVVRACRAAVPHMIAGQSSILNISSVAAQRGEPVAIDYAAAKAALDSYTKSLSTWLAPRGIRVNAIAPGNIATSLWSGEGGLAEQAGALMGIPPQQVMEESAAQKSVGAFWRTGGCCGPGRVPGRVGRRLHHGRELSRGRGLARRSPLTACRAVPARFQPASCRRSS